MAGKKTFELHVKINCSSLIKEADKQKIEQKLSEASNNGTLRLEEVEEFIPGLGNRIFSVKGWHRSGNEDKLTLELDC